ncbi:Sodium/solute symporter [Niveomyces insectorum RCEF 264]|uniref:Sodium/solute symporter n=1 Tax=Niveomyces insectorum RCEF 264 TaxID=1081102 RepID=A0A167XQ02_9HYPO|nr:Sodium/solute symporter [Niveomyces insectorum RCEF 264]
MSSYSVGAELQVLSPGVGYGILAGIGAVFTVVMIATTQFQNRYSQYSSKQSEEFNTASRSVKPGLIVAGIVSSWTWSATLLTSSTFAYSYGISGPMWYAALGSSQVLLFSMLSLMVKRDLPGAHTFPEIVLARHGPVAHAIYLVFGWVTNMFVGATLVLGGAQVVAGLSGVNVYGACFIIPIAVAAYVIQGGLRSTFVADYIHTVILFIVIFTFAFALYTTNDYVGSPGRFYELLTEAAKTSPLPYNRDGSWLTFQSHGGLVFAAIIFLGSFSTVWLDQAYWQRAIASKPETSVKAYLLGGLAWYGIPYGFATAMGLGCVAMTGSPTFPTFPNALSPQQVGGGFSAPATAIALMGKNGAALMLLLLFMAITSATSAELIAVSSLWTFDIYKLYINRAATSAQLVYQAHYSIVAYSLILAAFCCGLSASGIDITWILTQGGCIIGGGGIPLGLVLLWPSRMSTPAAIAAPLIAMPLGIMTWLVTTHLRSGVISVATTGDITNSLAGSATTCGTGAVVAVVFSFLFPYKYTSSDPAHVARVDKIRGIAALEGQHTLPGNHAGTDAQVELALSDNKAGDKADDVLTGQKVATTDGAAVPSEDDPAVVVVATGNDVVDFLTANHIEPLNLELYHKVRRLAIYSCAAFFVFAMVLFPFTFYGTGFIFTKAALTGWVAVSLIWVFFSALACIVWPLAESFGDLRIMVRMMIKDVRSRQ